MIERRLALLQRKVNAAMSDGVRVTGRLRSGREWERKIFESHLRAQYKITVEDWARMYDSQQGKCALCLDVFGSAKRPNVDHCHETGRVRGLLCTTCNLKLSLVEEVGLQALWRYLRTHDGNCQPAQNRESEVVLDSRI